MKKRLTKSNSNIVLSGCLAGVAEYFGIDPTIVRILFLVFFFAGFGLPLPLYIGMMVLMPKKTGQPTYHRPGEKKTSYDEHYDEHPYYQQPKKQSKKMSKDDEWSDF